MPTKKGKSSKQRAIAEKIGRVYDPRTGHLIPRTAKAVERVASAVLKEYRRAVAKRNKAARQRYGGAKKPETQRRYDRQYRDAARAVAKFARKLDVAQDQLRRTRVAVTRRVLPKVLEIGLSYSAAKGIASDVNFNIRVRKTDGSGLTVEDARRAMRAIAAGDEGGMPDDLEVSAVDWSRPSRVSRGGTAAAKRNRDGANAFAFANILAVAMDEQLPIRIGEVKDDRIGS